MSCNKIRAVTLLWLLVSALCIAVPHNAEAAEIKMSGIWQVRPFSWAQRNLREGNADDRLRAANRLRMELEVIASENLKGVFAFQLGHQNWGWQSQGGALGTDGKVFAVRRSYVDWCIPSTDTRVRMGLQLLDLPSFTSMGNAIINTNVAGVSVSHQFNEQAAATLFWTRMENDNSPVMNERGTTYEPHDALDYVGFTFPVKTETFRMTPWGMYGLVGQNSLKNAGSTGALAQNGMLPLGASSALAGTSDKAQGYSWYAGVAAQWKPIFDLKLALDAAYGTVDMGTAQLKGRSFTIKRSGWYAALLGEYTLDFGTPGLIFWYASGDDGDPYNGSERLPSIAPDMVISSYGSGNTMYGGAANTLGYGLSGTWAAMFRITNMSFYEKLTHTLRLIYMQGTNSRQMVRQGFITNPQATVASFAYMTTSDKAVEVNFDSNYKLYDNLIMSLELGYIRMQQDTELWKSIGYEASKNNFKATLSFNYLF